MTGKHLSIGLVIAAAAFSAGKTGGHAAEPSFQTSDRCFACHNGLITRSGRDVSIGFQWRSSIMANSSYDPYWQASMRRESIDHPEAINDIQDECSVCHMPIVRYEAHLRGKTPDVFSRFPIQNSDRAAADGVSCAVCHQITSQNFGKPESYNGRFVIGGPDAEGFHPEYGPYEIDKGHRRIMWSSTEGYRPEKSEHIRRAELCATCHTLITKALGPGGKVVGSLPEQMPYEEWLHSSYRDRKTCQDCHMPAVGEPVPVTRVFGLPREGAREHVFVGANFFMQEMLNRYRTDLGVRALPEELSHAAANTKQYLKDNAATVALDLVAIGGGQLQAGVIVRNMGGHKLPTAYPARRAWLHVRVRDGSGRTVFESGALRPDGSIEGNDNDADPARYEPHYSEIRSPDQVQIFEAILGDTHGRVTTGLLNAVGYLKDNRLLPDGFDKATADRNVAPAGAAMADPNFRGGEDRVQYSVPLGDARGPFTVDAELWYEPIGYRWANNLKPYNSAVEPRTFTTYFDSMQSAAAVQIAQDSRVVR